MLAPTPSSPNTEPTGYDQRVEFSSTDNQYIEDYTHALQSARLSGKPTEELEQTIENGVTGALSKNEAHSLQLIVAAESLGATTNQEIAGALLDIIRENPLLAGADQADVTSLSELAGNLWLARQQGMTDETIASALADRIEAILGSDDLHSEAQVRTKEALRVAIRALYAGATIHLPQFQGGPLLLDEVHSRQAL